MNCFAPPSIRTIGARAAFVSFRVSEPRLLALLLSLFLLLLSPPLLLALAPLADSPIESPTWGHVPCRLRTGSPNGALGSILVFFAALRNARYARIPKGIPDEELLRFLRVDDVGSDNGERRMVAEAGDQTRSYQLQQPPKLNFAHCTCIL